MKFRDKDFRALSEAETLQYALYFTAPHQDKEWFHYFCTSINGFMLFNVFLANESKGKGTRVNELILDNAVGNVSPMGYESVKKKLAEGIKRGVLHKHTCDQDSRTKIYNINNDIREEIMDYLVHVQKQRMLNIFDSFEDIFTMAIIKSWFKLFAERWDETVANRVISTLTSKDTENDIFK